MLTVYSCTKDSEQLINDSESLQYREDGNQSHYFEPNDTVKLIILGEKITKNPFFVDNMTIAWNILYPDCRVTRLNPTDNYIKFEPNSAEQVYDLKKDINLTFFEFPLDYHVIQMGDYYDNPGAGEFPNFYGIFSSGQSMPANDGREVLSELYLDDSDPLLNAVAMINDGYPMDVISDYIGPIDRTDIDDCASIIIPPDPEIPCESPCVLLLRIRDDVPPINGKPQMEWYCDCSGDPESGTGGGWTGPYTTNECRCKVYANQRKPGGCFTVWDANESSVVGVRGAKIIIKNSSSYRYDFLWSRVRTTFTDDNGCWKINDERRGTIWMWVEFNNEKAYVRGPNGINLLRYTSPVADFVGAISGPDFNDIEVHYPLWTDVGSQLQRYWVSAIALNTIDQMYKYCDQEGINRPPHLDIYHENMDFNEAAWMAHYGGLLSNDYVQILGLWGPSLVMLPDIILNRRRAPNRLAGVAFHEFTHGSHFINVGPAWYNILTSTEFHAGGHGDSTEPGAGVVAVAESWADHIGELFDLGNTDISNDMEELVLEGNGFIPQGLHYDLYDIGVEPLITGISDNVSGFTNQMIFNTLNSQVTSIPQYSQRLWNNFHTAPGVMATEYNYNLLFNSYGY